MRSTVADPTLVACCGLYCGSCGAYLNEQCSGCRQSEGNTACGVRKCVCSKGINTCADCIERPSPAACRKIRHSASKVFGMNVPADRAACLEEVRQMGLMAYCQKMAALSKPLFRQP